MSRNRPFLIFGGFILILSGYVIYCLSPLLSKPALKVIGEISPGEREAISNWYRRSSKVPKLELSRWNIMDSLSHPYSLPRPVTLVLALRDNIEIIRGDYTAVFRRRNGNISLESEEMVDHGMMY